MLRLLTRIKAVWDREGFGSNPNVSDPLYERLASAIDELTPAAGSLPAETVLKLWEGYGCCAVDPETRVEDVVPGAWRVQRVKDWIGESAERRGRSVAELDQGAGSFQRRIVSRIPNTEGGEEVVL
jgi:hypothetical protein